MTGRPKDPPFIRRGGGPAVSEMRGPRQGPPPRQLGPLPTSQRRHASYATAVGATLFNTERDAYEAIVKESKAKRNSIIIKSSDTSADSGPRSGKSPMDQKEWADLIFDICEIEVDEVTGIDFHAGSNLAAEVQLKKEVDPNKYVGKNHVMKGMTFEVTKVETDSTRVTFKSVPLSVPNEELIHLVKCYGGKMEKEEVQYELLKHTTNKGHTFEVKSTTRYVNAIFPPTKRLKRFYWVQGPLPKDPMRRIVVEHAGQIGRQCGHCLRNSADPVLPCSYNGKTSACRKNNFEGRLTLSKYFAQLRQEDNYVSLKTQYQWNTEEDDFSTQRFSDEFVEAGDLEGEMEEGTNNFTTNTKHNPHKAPLSKEAAPGEGEEPVWAEEMEEMKWKLQEKEAQLEKEKKEKSKAKGESRRMSREAHNMRKEISHNRQSVYNQIAQIIDDRPKFVSDLFYNTTVLSNCLNLKDFKINEEGVVEEVEGTDPWNELKVVIATKANPMTEEYLQERMVNLIGMVKDKLKVKLEAKGPSRSRSQSRSRSEDDEEAGPAKSAKMEQQNEMSDKPPSEEGPEQGSNQQ